jgi:hypothetical protein
MSTDKDVDVLGIDISKAKFDVALLKGNDKTKKRYSPITLKDLRNYKHG